MVIMVNMNDNNDNQTTVAIDISGPLKIKPKDMLKYVTVKVDDKVVEHDLIASKKSMFGKTEIKSPVGGVVVNIDTVQGSIVVSSGGVDVGGEIDQEIIKNDEGVTEQESNEVSISIPVNSGENLTENYGVPEELKSEGVAVEKKYSRAQVKHKVVAIAGFGVAKGFGFLMEAEFTDADLKPELEGRILLIDSIPTKLEMYKASAIGIEAIITNNGSKNEAKDLQDSLEGKAQIAFLLLPADVDIAKLNDVDLEVKDNFLIVKI